MKKKKGAENFNDKMKSKSWHEIDRSQVPHSAKTKSSEEIKSRVTIYLDADLISHFKEKAERSGDGYQTLINKSLREVADMNIQRYKYNVEAFDYGHNIELSTALEHIQKNGWIKVRANYLIVGKPFFKDIILPYNDVAGRNLYQVYDFLNNIIERDLSVVGQETQVGFGTLVDNIARKIEKDLGVTLHSSWNINATYGENDFIYDSDSVSYIKMYKAIDSITKRVIVFDRSFTGDVAKDEKVMKLHTFLPILIDEIESKMKDQIKIWLK
jgi:uncharacterized protein (DUF4415 family)